MESAIRQSVLENLREFSTPGRPVYLVGGAVRDMLLSRPVHDMDFALPGKTRKVANELACRMNGALYMLDEERDTCRVILDSERGRFMVDFATLRGEDLEADLRARDFTINALAFDVSQPDRLIDPLGGSVDLRQKVLRACNPDSLRSDPVRVLRAARMALQFQLRILPDTLQQMRDAAPLLANVSPERQRDELFRMFDGPRVDLALRVLDQVGALERVLPELAQLKGLEQPAPHTLDAWEHTLSVVRALELLLGPLVGEYQEEQVPDLTIGSAVLWLGRFRERLAQHFSTALNPERSLRALLFFAALYHDIAKPETRAQTAEGRVRFLGHDLKGAALAERRGRALALSVAEIERSSVIIEHHMRVHQLAVSLGGTAGRPGDGKLTRRAIYRFFHDAGAAGVDIGLLTLADTRGTYGVTLDQQVWQAELETCRALFEAYWEKTAEVVSPPRYLTGSDIITTLNLPPGPVIGQLLDAVREAQAVGEVGDRQSAFDFVRRYYEKQINKEDQPWEEKTGRNSTTTKNDSEDT